MMKKYMMMCTVLVVMTGCDTAKQILTTVVDVANSSAPGISSTEIAAALKQALTIGTQNGNSLLAKSDGYFANAAVKILLPEEAKKVETTLRNVGLGSLVDKAVLSMNRAAEDAAKNATPIFTKAIQEMSIADAIGILKGGDFAATNYFKDKTTTALTTAFKPTITNALGKTNATKYWSDVFTAYNKFAAKPINPDLTGYVTERAINGIFYQVQLEEQKIRQNPAARVTDLLKKVFGSSLAQGK